MPLPLRSILVVALWALLPAPARSQDLPEPEAVAALQSSLTAVIARTAPSVVAIARVRKEKPGEVFNLEFRPDPFGRRTVPPVAVAPTDPEFLPNEYGTGVAIDRQGLILTAYHVLAPESDYYVTTHEHKVYPAQIKAADPRSDLAVLAIETGDLVPIRLGDAAQLRKGQFVVALGNPCAIARDGQASASWGIVANLNRKAPLAADEADSPGRRTLHQFGTLIQTDAKLSLGTSGGPLVNLRGEMVGLSVALAATAGYEQAAGYAIPIDATFRRVIDTLRQGREVEYGFLGVRPMNLRAQEVRDGRRGVRVQNVVPGTPADRFGIRPEDVITAVAGKPIDSSDGLMLEVGRMPADAQVRFTLLRGSEPLEIPVRLAKYPVQGTKIVTTPSSAWRGLRVEYSTAVVDAPWASQVRAARVDDGVVAIEVTEGSPAWKAGLRPGMLINRVDQSRVATPRQFQAAVAGKKGRVTLDVSTFGEESSATRVVEPGR
jgi:serine protease Do